jgi:CRISPR/Cas system-associated exonuclease Cas4 (RecB family)
MATEVNPAEVHALDLFDDPQLTVLDRSTLEAYLTCPFQAYAIETGKVKITNNLMAAGEEIHQAISRTVQWWIDCDGMPEEFSGRLRGAITEYLEGELRASRPDVQPQVLAGARASLWSFAEFLSGIRPVNILHFDGGEGERSGQLAIDLGGLGVRATSELDLVIATESVEVLAVMDWKSGWKHNTAAEVYASFQFGLHAVLLFERYPGIAAVDVRVWDTRSNRRTYKVTFDRKREPELRDRLRMAAEAKMRYGANPPAWPTVEKCATCPAAVLCPEADDFAKEATTDPTAVLGQLIATDQRKKLLHKWLSAHVKKTGKHVVLENHAFGQHKKTDKAPPMQVYPLKAEASSDESEESQE